MDTNKKLAMVFAAIVVALLLYPPTCWDTGDGCRAMAHVFLWEFQGRQRIDYSRLMAYELVVAIAGAVLHFIRKK